MTTKESGSRAKPVKIIVIDVLKAHKPNIVDFSRAICAHASVEAVNAAVYATDEKTESVKITIEGKNLRYNAVKKIIEDYGAAVHSVDKAVIGKREIIPTPDVFGGSPA